MSDEKKIEFSQSDVLNALLHQQSHAQNYATKESVDNIKERVHELAINVDRRFDLVDKRFDEMKTDVDKRFDLVDKRFDEMKTDVDRRF
ncbi:hypothetical protein, partial [uncultured Vibrio sp.]|uniref:hypothetical protein n=1 Tax=uncultured Vibrio sp. TaxID=114054 RepID=UPI00262AA491